MLDSVQQARLWAGSVGHIHAEIVPEPDSSMPAKLDWQYFRPGWTSCKRTQEFLAQHGIPDGEIRSATKSPVEGPDAVLEVLEGVHDLYVTRGKKILHFDLTSGEPDREEILSLVLGRSGKLRSPAMKTGTTMLVGYTPELLESQLL